MVDADKSHHGIVYIVIIASLPIHQIGMRFIAACALSFHAAFMMPPDGSLGRFWLGLLGDADKENC